MKREAGGPCLSAVFVDYDNIYLSLKRKSEEAAKRFAKDASGWLRGIETGRLITATNAPVQRQPRRIVMNRCYGNPVPRRNTNDNSTDMNSFPFVRHHFLRAGFEVIDCPPLTAQLKNSSDIRMVMDIRDYLTHDTYFDEFIILSGDADFTPVLHRLRAHARRTVIFANDFTAAPYTAISDGEVRESDLIALILSGEMPKEIGSDRAIAMPSAKSDEIRREILAEVVGERARARARRCRWRRWPSGPCARSATRRPSAPAGPARAASASCCASSCRPRSSCPASRRIGLRPEAPRRRRQGHRAGGARPGEGGHGARQIASKPAAPESMPLTAAALQQALPGGVAAADPSGHEHSSRRAERGCRRAGGSIAAPPARPPSSSRSRASRMPARPRRWRRTSTACCSR